MKTTTTDKLLIGVLPAVLLGTLHMPLAVAGANPAVNSEQSTVKQAAPATESKYSANANKAARDMEKDKYGSNQQLKDAWLHGKIEAALALNPHLNPFTIDTQVDNGVARLSGHVESEIDKELAEQVARSVDGITDVKNQLQIEHDASASSGKSAFNSFRQKVEDATITAIIKSKLLANSETEGLSINVTTNNNEVSLKGAVSTDEEKNLAGLIAKNTANVKRVDNRIEVAN